MKTPKIIFVLLFVLVQAPSWAQQSEQSCFTASHFDLVNQYVSQKCQGSPDAVFNFEGYDIVAVNAQEIQFKKNGFKEAIIVRDKGVLAMSKSADQNKQITENVEKVFCHLFAEQKKNK